MPGSRKAGSNNLGYALSMDWAAAIAERSATRCDLARAPYAWPKAARMSAPAMSAATTPSIRMAAWPRSWSGVGGWGGLVLAGRGWAAVLAGRGWAGTLAGRGWAAVLAGRGWAAV